MARKLAFVFALGAIVFVLVMRSDAQKHRSVVIGPQSPTVANTGVRHIIWVWFENEESTSLNAVNAPFFTSFAAANVNLTNFFALTHPSQPNYLDAFSGSTQGVTNDNHFTFPASTDNLAKQMVAAGKSWRVYAQDYPGSCSDADTFTGGVDGPGVAGQYVRKHNPAISFESIRLDATQCSFIQPLANFDPTVNFAFVVPNMINDMHDGTIQQGDAFLQSFVPLVTSSPDWAHTLLIVTFDEGSTNTNGGGHIYTAAAAGWLTHASVTTTYNHFSVLRTIEEVYGLPFLGGAATATTMTELLPALKVRADFDGDGSADVAIYRNSEGNWYLNRSAAGFNVIHWGAAGGTDTLVPGDYDNDGKADIAVFRPDLNEANPDYFVLNSKTFTFTGVSWGVPGDKPVVGDFDGDGITDFAVFRPSNGTWYIIYSSGVGNQIQQFGVSTDIPLAMDLDGDGKTNLAVFRPSNNTWYIAKPTGVPAQNFDSIQFGQSGDKLVPADYDGDGKDDIAVFRPSNGTWYIISTKFPGTVNFIKFGQLGDIPVPGDYDGDGTIDIGVYRGGTWFINKSSAGFFTTPFGVTTDTPIPSVFNRDVP